MSVARRTVLIGHRGTGKTLLLRRIESYFKHENRAVQCLDLDREIERRSSRSIASIFTESGEEAFRKIERDMFRVLDEETSGAIGEIYLSCGAGFDPALIPETWRVMWIRRVTDAQGRIFMDRPRLNPRVPALTEFTERYHRRNGAYAQRADEVLWIDEGTDSPDEAEAGYFLDDWTGLDGAITLLPQRFRSEESLKAWITRRLKWGVRWIELRDDLLSIEQMEMANHLLPDEKTLVSFRSRDRQAQTEQMVNQNGLAFDWPLELGTCEFGNPRFLSLHERLPGQSLSAALARFPVEVPEGAQLKAALPVQNFEELFAGHTWHESMPEARIFLPLSADGRWAWYRLHQADALPLNFFREDEGSGPDQPALLQWARRQWVRRQTKAEAQNFAAVLGDPVAHSRSPLEQAGFFARKDASVYAIRMTEDEWRGGATERLHKIGLQWAAVTAPLKNLAFSSSQFPDKGAQELGSVNTLVWSAKENGWIGANTDIEGFRDAISEVKTEIGQDLGKIAVWGGGGTLNVVKAVLPDAELFSLRTGENREPGHPSAAQFKPDTVIWAVGRSRETESSNPTDQWKPKFVIDLNYTEDSPGRSYALTCQSRYFSGLTMFKHQAEAQRKFWEEETVP
jgi:shikimate 5-dehydrogenase/shikimate kinase